MRFTPRMLTKVLLDASRHFPSVVVAVAAPSRKDAERRR